MHTPGYQSPRPQLQPVGNLSVRSGGSRDSSNNASTDKSRTNDEDYPLLLADSQDGRTREGILYYYIVLYSVVDALGWDSKNDQHADLSIYPERESTGENANVETGCGENLPPFL